MRHPQIVEVDLICKTIECLLQTRLDVKKPQQKQFIAVTSMIHKSWEDSYSRSVSLLLSSLLAKELYNIRAKVVELMNLGASGMSFAITFTLIEKATGKRIDVEHWDFNFVRSLGGKKILESNETSGRNPRAQGEGMEEGGDDMWPMVVYFIEELLLLLNRQPLLKEYHCFLKPFYILDHALELKGIGLKEVAKKTTKSTVLYPSSKKKGLHLLHIPSKYDKIRASPRMQIAISCYFLPSLEHLHKGDGKFLPKRKLSPSEDEHTERKRSVYTFFDKDLDITFISSDNSSFQDTEMETFDPKSEQDCQFELLFCDDDEKFIDQNSDLFSKLCI